MRVFIAGGKDEFSWHEVIDMIAEAVDKKKWKIPAPGWGVKSVAFLLPITKDQVTMLMEGNTCDSSDFFSHFEIEPIPFQP